MHFEKRIPMILELGFREEALPMLKAYVNFLWASNEDLNLISRKMGFEDLVDNHIIDCLLPLRMFPTELKNVADFGSGGGMPGVIYALQFPETTFHLYEKSHLKQDFLNLCKKIAPNIQIHGDIPLILNNTDLIMARAFKPVDVILDMSRGYYRNKGKYFLLKGRREKIDEEIALALKKFKDLEVRIEALKSPALEVERHLILI